jgi:phenylacetate-CoA ligase
MPAPWMSRRVVYPLHERLMKRPTFAYLESLEESQWLSRADLEGLQARKLTRLLQTAAKHSPWHAERIQAAGLDVGEDCAPVTLEELRRLPVMTKQDARTNVDRMFWAGVPGGASRYNTGGSSGEPLIFYFGRLRQASDAAGRIRARRWWRVDVGEREAYLWGAPAELNKTDRIKTIRDGLLNQLVLNAFAMSAANMDAYLETVQAFRPK